MVNFIKLFITLTIATALSGCTEDPTVSPPFGRSCTQDSQCGVWDGEWVPCTQNRCAYKATDNDTTITPDLQLGDTALQPGCTQNSECDNHLFCDGTEACVEGLCVKVGIPPCGVGATADSRCNEDYDECGSCANRGQKWCDDGVDFTTETCESLVEGKAQCVYTVTEGWCYINQQAYHQADVNPNDECQTCDWNTDPEKWTNLQNCPEIVVTTDTSDTETAATPEVTNTDADPPDIFIPPDTEEVTELDTGGTDSFDIPPDTTEPAEIIVDQDITIEDIGNDPDVEEIVEPLDTEEPDTFIDLCEGIICDDGNPCTDNACSPAVGCVYVNNNTNTCEDGNPCTSNDACAEGNCISGSNICECNTDQDCLVHEDGDFCNGLLVCTTHQCAIAPETIIICDTSQDSQCQFARCMPDTGECEFVNEQDGIPCQDDDTCTIVDRCEAGLCAGKQRNCDDESICTTDSCNPATGCTYTPINCTDNDACTEDSCFPGTGCFHDPSSCEDNDECTFDACVGGVCQNLIQPAGTSCDDNSVCTFGDLCFNKECVGKFIDCDDDNICTTDSCNPATGCTHTPNTEACSDSNACTLGDVCTGSLCISGSLLDCDDNNVCTTDSCHPATGLCVNTPLPDIDNDNVCDLIDDDADNDGVKNANDNCWLVTNSDQEDVLDEDGTGDACDLSLDCDLIVGVAAFAWFGDGLSNAAKANYCLSVCVKKKSRTLVCYVKAHPELYNCSKDYDGDGLSEQEGDCDNGFGPLKCECAKEQVCAKERYCSDLGWTTTP